MKQFDPLIGRTIVDVEERDLGRDHEEEDTDGDMVTKAHCLVFTTDGGHETIDWRNDSNGYYDGMVYFDVEKIR